MLTIYELFKKRERKAMRREERRTPSWLRHEFINNSNACPDKLESKIAVPNFAETPKQQMPKPSLFSRVKMFFRRKAI